jgi:hypothetical protein
LTAWLADLGEDINRAARRHPERTEQAEVPTVAGTIRGPTDPNYQMAALTVVNGLIELGATWWRGDLDASRDQIAEFMVAMILTSADIGSRLGRALSDANQT